MDAARVYAWNALVTVQPEEATRLRHVAEELGDEALVAELERRGVSSKPSEAAAFRLRNIAFPLAVMGLLLALAANTIASEAEAPKIEKADTAKVMPQRSPIVTQRDGIWLVRIGNSERVPLRKLAGELTRLYDLPVGLLPEIDPLPDYVVNEKDEELDGDVLVELLEQWYGARRQATIIGITDYPMLSHELALERPFMLRDSMHYAVISTADLGAGPLDRLRGHTRYQRTRKLVGRGIGFLYLMQPVSSDRKSLVRSKMSGADDIDDLVERL